MALGVKKRREYYLMESQQQNEKELAPWSHDEQLPRNIIIEFQNSKPSIRRTQPPPNKPVQTPLSINLQRFLERRHRASLKLAERKREDSPSPARVQINTLGPEKVRLNETMCLNQMFPSYNLKNELESTFYKPERYHSIHSNQEDSLRLTLFRKSLNTTNKPDKSNLLTRNFTSKKTIHRLAPSDRSSQTLEKPIIIEADAVSRNKFAVALKSTTKQYRYEQIMEMIEKKQQQKSLQRSKTEPDAELLEKCLKSKKQLFLNLPKIQFMEVCQ